MFTRFRARAVGLLALFAMVTTGSAWADNQNALICVKNNTQSRIYFSYRLGSQWHESYVAKGGTWQISYLYKRYLGQIWKDVKVPEFGSVTLPYNRYQTYSLPEVAIHFDSDLTAVNYFVTWQLPYTYSTESQCTEANTRYTIDYEDSSGRYIDLYTVKR